MTTLSAAARIALRPVGARTIVQAGILAGCVARGRHPLLFARAQHSHSPSHPSYEKRTQQQSEVEFPVDLLASLETEGRPDLKALDELIPQSDQRPSKRFDAAENWKVWQRAMKKVNESFTVAQLNDLISDARVPEDLLAKHARLARKSKRTKDVLASALLVHRFGIDDPKSREMEEKAREEVVEEAYALSLPTAYLLFIVKMDECQSILQRHGVSFKARSSEKESQVHNLKLVGRPDGVEAVKRWLDSFASGVKSMTRPLTELTSSSREALEMPDPVLLREISVASKSVITLDDSDLTNPLVTISSIDIKWLRVACTLLVQRQQDRHQLRNRAYLALTAPAVPVSQDASFPTYSLQPHFATPEGFSQGNLFRLARQDIAGGEVNLLNWEASASESTEDNTPVLTKVTDDDRHAEAVLESLAVPLVQQETKAEIVYSAQFGHLVFSHDSFTSPPLSGAWPVEKALGWLGEDLTVAQQANTLPTIAPHFLQSTPPSALDITTHDAQDAFRRRAEKLDDDLQSILSGIGVPEVDAQSKFKGMLSKEKQFDESLLVRYTDGQETVEMRLQKNEKEDGGGIDDRFGNFDDAESFDDLELFSKESRKEEQPWTMDGIRRARETQADVLVPDASVDIRFTASQIVELEASEMVEGEEWQAYIATLEKHSFASLTAKHAHGAPSPPFHVTIQGKQYSLVDQYVESKWTWDIVEDPSFNPFRTEVKYTLTHNVRTDSITPALRLQWNKRSSEEDEGQGEGPLAPAWSNIRRTLGAALSEGYGMGNKF